MKKTLTILFVSCLCLTSAWFAWKKWNEKKSSSGHWMEDLVDTFDRPTLGPLWYVSDQSKSVSKIELKDKTLNLSDDLYSPYCELWLEKKYEGPVRMEFDLNINLKKQGEFGVRVSASQTDIVPNTPAYEVYMVWPDLAVIKRSDRDEQVSSNFTLPQDVLSGKKPVHLSVEKDFRRVRLKIGQDYTLEYPDPEVLSGAKFSHCGFFLMAGQAKISDLMVSVFPKGLETDDLAQAYDSYTDGNYSQALSYYDNFLKNHPDSNRSLEVRFREALCYKYLENYTESTRILHALMFNVVDKEYVPDALFFLGEIYRKMGILEDGEKYFQGFIERFPLHPYVPKAYEQLALCQWSLKRAKDALATTDVLLHKYPDSITAVHSRYFRGKIYESMNEKGLAVNEYKTLLASVQKDIVANLARKALREITSKFPSLASKSVRLDWSRSSLKIAYQPETESPLKYPKEVFVHWGHNGWQAVLDRPMARSENGWQAELPLENGTRSVEFVFTDGAGNWDNNGGLNWELDVPGKK